MSACGKDLTGLPEWVRADYYQAHKKHDCLFGDAEPTVVKPRKLDTIISTRFNSEEVHWLAERAALEGISMSALVRRAALSEPSYFVKLDTPATGWTS